IETVPAAEGDDSVTARFSVTNTIDGEHGKIVDGMLYVQVAVTGEGNAGGTVTAADTDGNPLAVATVTNPAGLPEGTYYAIAVGEDGSTVEVTYHAPDGQTLQPGSIEFIALVQSQEKDATNVVTATEAGAEIIEVINNGVEVISEPVRGEET